MALIFKGVTQCAICNKVLQESDAIIGLPASINTSHFLYSFFDCGFHQTCYNNWEHKTTVEKMVDEERLAYENSDYYKSMYEKYGAPKYITTTKNE